MTKGSFRILSYNIHGGIGNDGQFDLGRIAEVIRILDPDIVALQEVDYQKSDGIHRDGFEHLVRAFGGHAVPALTMDLADRSYGNLLLSRWPIETSEILDLNVATREPRNAINAVIRAPNGPIRMLCTHLGLRGGERRHQGRILAKALENIGQDTAFVAGDFNDWRPLRDISASLHDEMVNAGRKRTWPARLPLFPLDRILKRRGMTTERSEAYRSTLSRVASDHLPLIAEVRRR